MLVSLTSFPVVSSDEFIVRVYANTNARDVSPRGYFAFQVIHFKLTYETTFELKNSHSVLLPQGCCMHEIGFSGRADCGRNPILDQFNSFFLSHSPLNVDAGHAETNKDLFDTAARNCLASRLCHHHCSPRYTRLAISREYNR